MIWPGGRLFEAKDAAPHRCLAAPALADEPQRLAAADRQIDAVHGFHVADLAAHEHAFGDREMHLQPAHLKQRLRGRSRRSRLPYRGDRGFDHRHAASPDTAPSSWAR